MIIFLILIIALLFLAPPITLYNNSEVDYISKESTLPVKGFFVCCVFFSHIISYLQLNDSFLNSSFLWIIGFIGQLMVTMFFFYSGYGIITSYKRKDQYMKYFLVKRLLPVWISFVICILLFLIQNAFLGIYYSNLDICLSFIGWTSIGNSSWFIFVTFVLYFFFYFSFRFIKKERIFACLTLFTLLCIALVVLLYFFKESYWYNTLLCFPLGMWFACYKQKIDMFVFKKISNYVLVLLCSIAVFVILYFVQSQFEWAYCLYSMSFALVVVFFTMIIRFRSIPLAFLGKHIFSIYILQRMVFIFADHHNLISNSYLFLIISFVITLIIAFIYDYIFDKVKNIFESKFLSNSQKE